MKIIQLCAHFFPVIGGKETAVFNISKELIKLGHEVIIFTSDLDKEKRRIKEVESDYEGVKVKRFKSWFMVGPTAVFFPGIIKDLLTIKYDLIIAHTYRQPQTDISLLCAKIRRKKCVLMTHNPLMYKREKLNKIAVKLYDLIFSHIFLRMYNLVLCLSNEISPFFKKHGVKSEKIKTVPMGFENIFLNVGESTSNEYNKNSDLRKRLNIKTKIVLNVATLVKEWTKGQDLLLNAIPFTKNKAAYIFVGPDEGIKKDLEAIAGEKELKDIFFLGSVNKNDLPEIYKQCDVFVLPSRAEGFGIVTLEAMICGLPVVVTKFGVAQDFIRMPYGKLVDPFNPEELAEAIDYFLKNPYNGSEGIEKAKEYSWAAIVEKLEKYLLQVLN
jgi:glycosyltransferase involved in cell wall biosynthesis